MSEYVCQRKGCAERFKVIISVMYHPTCSTCRGPLTLTSEAHIKQSVATSSPSSLSPGNVHPDVVSIIEGSRETHLIKTLRKLFAGDTSGGRSAPDTPYVEHIHIGGDANYNILFTTHPSVVILGFVYEHIDSGRSGTKAAAISHRAHDGKSAVRMQINKSSTVERVPC